MKKRLDVLLVERGLATSREKAKAMIMAGEVLVDNEREAGTRWICANSRMEHPYTQVNTTAARS